MPDAIEPHYLNTDAGEFRYFIAGTGTPLVAIGGLVFGAGSAADQLREMFPERRIVVIEPPGVGGSARIDVSSLTSGRAALRSALESLGLVDAPIVAFDLSAAFLTDDSPSQWPSPIALKQDDAIGWATADLRPPDLHPRDDGTHLPALWIFLRDRGILIPEDPSLPRTDATVYPDPQDLSAAFIPAVTEPIAFERMWNLCLDEFQHPGPGFESLVERSRDHSLRRHLTIDSGDGDGDSISVMPQHQRRRHEAEIWHDYVDTVDGRVHLRRSGTQGPPIVVLPTGGGSSAQFAPVISGLARGRQVIGIDYLGNGLSDKTADSGTIQDLASEIVNVMDALEIPQADLWGSHTGACVGLEIAVTRPDRVRRLVMEGPVVISQEFQDDLLCHYFPDFTPDTFGLHLHHIWHWRRDMFMFWPWYRNEPSAARQLGVPTADDIHLYAVGILESGTTYSRAYRAAFGYPTLERLPLLTVPSIITAGPNDMLANSLDDALKAIPAEILSVIPTPTTVWWPDPDPTDAEQTMEIYRSFLGI